MISYALAIVNTVNYPDHKQISIKINIILLIRKRITFTEYMKI